MKSTKINIAALALLALSAAWAGQAQAHTHLIAASPAEDAAVPSPSNVRLEFSEPLQPMFSSFDIVGPDGAQGPVKGVVDKKNNKLMAGTVKGKLKPGAYTVNWRAISTDSHRTSGSYSFKVK